MASVIEGVLSIEKQADEIVAAARQQALEVELQAKEAVARRRAELEGETAARIAALRREAEAKHRVELEQAEAELREALAALDRLDGRVLDSQAAAVVARFREL